MNPVHVPLNHFPVLVSENSLHEYPAQVPENPVPFSKNTDPLPDILVLIIKILSHPILSYTPPKYFFILEDNQTFYLKLSMLNPTKIF